MTGRKRKVDVETGAWWFPRDKHGGSLLTARAASGLKAARVRFRLKHGTLEPVVSMLREISKGRPPKGSSTDARHRGGTTRSSGDRRETDGSEGVVSFPFQPTGSTAKAGGIHG